MVVDITVRGEAEASFPAERAVVMLAASFEDGSKQQVYDAAVAVQQAITAQVIELADLGAVSTWSSGQVAISTHRPWRENGTQGPPVHVARIDITAEFVEFDRLGGFFDHWAGRDGVEVRGIRWDVLERNRRGYEVELRKAAVEDAVARAQVYADALRRGRVVAVRIADPGLLNSTGGPVPHAMKFEMAADAGGGVQLTPEQIVIHVAVDAGFAAE